MECRSAWFVYAWEIQSGDDANTVSGTYTQQVEAYGSLAQVILKCESTYRVPMSGPVCFLPDLVSGSETSRCGDVGAVVRYVLADSTEALPGWILRG